MTSRMKLILTRPTDDSLDSYISFRQKTTLRSSHNQKSMVKDDLVDEWKKFWDYINKTQKRKTCLSNYSN